MTQRLDYTQLATEASAKYLDFTLELTRRTPWLAPLKHLVMLRSSQLNGCAFCVDMHVKEARIHDERELRLHHVAIWHESPLFSARERAALAWTEVLTHLPPKGVSEAEYAQVREQFSEREVAELTYLIIAINGWNRLGVAFTAVPGSCDELYGLDKSGLH